jgi:hypothetical protein
MNKYPGRATRGAVHGAGVDRPPALGAGRAAGAAKAWWEAAGGDVFASRVAAAPIVFLAVAGDAHAVTSEPSRANSGALRRSSEASR